MAPYLVLSAVVPSFLFIWYFYATDKHREPLSILLATFGFGILTVFPVLLVADPIQKIVSQWTDPFIRGAGEAFLTAGLPEEFFKYVVVLCFAMRRKAFDEPMDGVVYGVVASLGFATFENILYVSGGGINLAILRAVTAVPGHACFGAIMGYFIGQYKFSQASRPHLLFAAYFAPATLHSLYDFPLLTIKWASDSGQALEAETAGMLILFTLAVLLFSIAWAIRLSRNLRREQNALALLKVQQEALLIARLSEGPVQASQETGAPSVAELILAHQKVTQAWAEARVSSSQPYEGATLPKGAVPQKNKFISWLFLLLGGLLSTLGSSLVLVFLGSFGEAKGSWSDGLAAVLIFGLPALGIGLLLFRLGLKRLRPPKQGSGKAIPSEPGAAVIHR